MYNKVKKLFFRHWPLMISGVLFFVLLLKNPYSTRTLIPNFEPFPDAFYYVTTPLCYVSGNGWKMCRLHNPELQGIDTVVGPLYSLSLLPSLFIFKDPRSFYFSNVLLAFLSLFLLYKIASAFFTKKSIVFFVILLYVTNYYVYWYPSLAMAENILIPLFLLSVYLLQTKATKLSMLVAGLVVPGFYAAKYAYVSLSGVFLLFYTVKLFSEYKENKKSLLANSQFFLVPTLAGSLLLFDVQQLLFFVNNLFVATSKSGATEEKAVSTGYFSTSYLAAHIPRYASALYGKTEKFLWSTVPLLPAMQALPALIGHGLAWTKKQSIPRVYLIVASLTQLVFMSSFYVVDIRYVFHLLPVLLLGLGFTLVFISKKIPSKPIFFLVTAVLLFIYLITNAQKLKSQIMINLKYAETPWWYLSIKEANTYFEKNTHTEKAPYLITLAAPYLHDFYPSASYKLLPLHPQQDFSNFKENVWGIEKSKTLIDLYREKIKDHSLFVTTYGTSATPSFQAAFNEIKSAFDLEEVQNGCHTTCVLYKLHEKK